MARRHEVANVQRQLRQKLAEEQKTLEAKVSDAEDVENRLRMERDAAVQEAKQLRAKLAAAEKRGS